MTKSIRFAIAAAALMITVTEAAAQHRLRATVPFDFSVPGAKLSAGNYEVVEVYGIGSMRVTRMMNVNTLQSVLLSSRFDVQRPLTAQQPQLEFACSNGECSLATIWGLTEVGRGFARPSRSPAIEIARIPLRLAD